MKAIESGPLPAVEDMLSREARRAATRQQVSHSPRGCPPRTRDGRRSSSPSVRLERDIERSAVAAMRKRGISAPKFVSPGRRSAPDRLVLPGNGLCLFLEFKRPGEKPTPLQELEHKRLREAGYTVGVPTSTEEAMSIIEEFMMEHGRGAKVRND
ncbi:MAG TPA: hypothetical protein VKT27_02805 [Candidatus Binataceae bacterium]|nr:hypothetical protein [Candidatus Binataceae bacterium]